MLFSPQLALARRGASGGAGGGVTWNPSDKDAAMTLSNGNLTATSSGAADIMVRATTSHNSSKYYVEFTAGATMSGGDTGVGICTSTATGSGMGLNASNAVIAFLSGNVWINGIHPVAISSWTVGDVVGMAVDFTNSRIWFRKNGGLWFNDASANPATNVNGLDISSLFPSNAAFPTFVSTASSGSICTVNFGGTAYGTAAPSGFGNW